MRILFTVSRVTVAVAIIAAIVAQLISSVSYPSVDRTDQSGTVVLNFLSYFTIDSNGLAALVLLIGAGLLIVGRLPEPRWFAIGRSSVVTYMVVTGVVYNLLLRGLLQQGATVPWSNEVLHVIAPLYLLIDWVFAPGRNKMPTSKLWAIIVFPVLWVIYTLVRGPFATDPYTTRNYWYPYPFLNPNTAAEGYFTVFFYVVMIALLVIATAIGVLWLSRRLDTKGRTR